MSSILSFLYPHELDVVLHLGQSLEPSSRGTTSPGSPGHSAVSTWCFPPAKALILRRGAPRRPARPGIWRLRRGASPRQSLDLSSRGTTSPAPDGHSADWTWCFTPAKALIFRRGAPRRPRRPALLHARRAIGLGRAPAARPFRKHQKRAAVDFSKRQLSSFHKFNTFSSGYTNIVTNGMVNRDSRVVSA